MKNLTTVTLLEELAKRQAAFMTNPPPCGELIEFQLNDAERGLVGSIYWFASADVHLAAENMFQHNPQMAGLGGALRWTALNNQKNSLPSLVPSQLTSFSQIAYELIELGKGQIHCPICKKTYHAAELVKGFRRGGGYLFEAYSCQQRHELINIMVMHMLLKKCDD